ncbi:uncharacterized protein LOC129609423 [Condylostylus longicornis]|uniref:uncharacterized protein LOC129609423 n=1 Tax=Condylostylus longicornis TaxID=2530218 RepID=UPI00244E57D7|nr:uncharacterized protein LOC129609423 [Condylostylus longicornis]
MDHRNGHSYTNLRRSQSNNIQSSQDHEWPTRRRQITTQQINNRVDPQQPLTQHDELIKYIKDAWSKVNEPGPHGKGPHVYRAELIRPPVDFQPFDLEGFWGQRLVQNIHVNSSGHQ